MKGLKVKVSCLSKAFFLTIFLAGCSPMLRNQVPLPAAPDKVIAKSFSLSFPLKEESGWTVGVQNDSHLILGRRGPSPDETRIVRIDIEPLQIVTNGQDFSVLAESIKNEVTKPGGSSRYEPLRREIEEVKTQGVECIKLRDTEKDQNATKITTNTAPMILDTLLWICKHPNGEDAILVGYSNRYYAGNEDPAFVEKAELIFRSVEFVNH